MEIFEKSGFSDKLRAGHCDWEENEPECEQRVRRFSDKTGREGMLCRKKLAVVCRELQDIPTNQFAQMCFVGIRSRFCAENSGIFRQNSLHGDVLSEWEPIFELEARCFFNKEIYYVCRFTKTHGNW